MSKQPETIFAEKIDKDLLEAFGNDITIFNIQQRTIKADPDRLICLKGKFIGLEIKVEKGKTDTMQLVKLLKIRQSKGLAYRVYPSTWESILYQLKQVYASL